MITKDEATALFETLAAAWAQLRPCLEAWPTEWFDNPQPNEFSDRRTMTAMATVRVPEGSSRGDVLQAATTGIAFSALDEGAMNLLHGIRDREGVRPFIETMDAITDAWSDEEVFAGGVDPDGSMMVALRWDLTPVVAEFERLGLPTENVAETITDGLRYLVLEPDSGVEFLSDWDVWLEP